MDKKIQEIADSLEREMKRLVTYVDEKVVPAARQEAHSLLKTTARELEKLAQKLEKEEKKEDTK
jgi:hypothetical protein